MAKKNIEGQLDMFELFDSVEELEEHIKGMPELTPEGKPVMQKSFARNGQSAVATVAYLDYHMVYVADWGEEPVIWQFEQSKDAVDFYVEQIERFSSEEQVTMQKKQANLQKACVRKRTGDGKNEAGNTES